MEINQSVSLPSKKYPIIIIGAGGIVADAHLPAYKKAGFEVIGIFDIDREKAKNLSKRFSISNIFENLDEIAHFSLDNEVIFDLAIPASSIAKTIAKLPDNATVLIQKPLGENLKQANEIVKTCREKNIKGSVNFQLRYAPFILAAQDMIRQGLIGEPHDFDLKLCVYTPWHLWEFLKGLPRVEILYHSIHYIDMIRAFLGDPNSVYAKTSVNPSQSDFAATKTHIIMDYGDFKKVNIDTNHGHEFDVRHQESYLKIEGTKGAIYIRIGLSMDYPKGKKDRFEYAIKDSEGAYQWNDLPLKGTWFPDAFIGPMAEAQKRMSDSKHKVATDIEDALVTMKVVEAAYHSSEKGGERI